MNEEVGPFTLFLVTLGADLINALQREGRLGISSAETTGTEAALEEVKTTSLKSGLKNNTTIPARTVTGRKASAKDHVLRITQAKPLPVKAVVRNCKHLKRAGPTRYDILLSLERSIHIVQSITARQSNRRRSHWNWSSGTSTTNNARHSGQQKKAEGPYYTKRYESPLYGRRLYLVKVTFQKRSNPPDEKLNSALLLSRRTYPPRDSWNFSPPFEYADTKSPLTTNQQTSSGWVLPGRSEQEGTPRRRFYSWAAVSRSRGRSAPCPRRWVICSQKMLLQSDLAGERSQFAAENKTASERTFVRFFSTKHGSLRITVGRWLPKETPIRSAPRKGGIYLIPITRRGSP
ncbi:unnamed protein product [Arabidopsis halleri]